jgi:hypothetical protein
MLRRALNGRCVCLSSLDIRFLHSFMLNGALIAPILAGTCTSKLAPFRNPVFQSCFDTSLAHKCAVLICVDVRVVQLHREAHVCRQQSQYYECKDA